MLPQLISHRLRHFFLRRLSLFLVERDYTLIFNRSCVGLLSPTCYRSSRISRGPHQHCHYTAFVWRRYSAAGIGLETAGINIRFPQMEDSLFSQTSSGSAAHPHSKPIATADAFPGGTWTGAEGCEVDHSTPSSAEAKNEWSCTSTPPHAFMECTGTTFAFILF
jgi:hypothetical protein